MFGVKPPKKELIEGVLFRSVACISPEYRGDPEGLGEFVSKGVAGAMTAALKVTLGGKGSFLPASVTDGVAEDMGTELTKQAGFEGKTAETLIGLSEKGNAEFQSHWPEGDEMREAVDDAISRYIVEYRIRVTTEPVPESDVGEDDGAPE